MKTFIVIFAVVAACSAVELIQSYPAATAYFRTPALDTSYVESSRLGGNFAYRTVEGQAYQSYTPLAYAAYPSYPAYPYIQAPFAAPAAYYPYQPAFFEQPLGFKPALAAAATEDKKETASASGSDDTVAVEAA